MAIEGTRRVMFLREGFFNDGPWYVLTSTSLGGSGLSAEEISERLQSGDGPAIQQLLRDGVCLPLFFDGDCALDHAVVVLGDLTPQEEAEWIGRIRSRLEIPCGEFMVLGGALEEDFETAMEHFEAPDPHFVNFSKFRVPPGTYLVELYAFVTSMTVNVAWDGMGIMHQQKRSKDELARWWQTTRPGQPYPAWLDGLLKTDDPGYDLGLLDYLIRLRPSTGEVPLPSLEPKTGWCGVFEFRKPSPCPMGIPRHSLGG